MKQKKDILFLCQFFHPEYISSAQLPYDTVKALQAAGYSVGVLCGYPQEYYKGEAIPTKENLDGVSVHRLKYIQLDRKGFLSRLVNYFSFTFMVFLHLMEMSRYKVVAVYSNPPILPWIASWAKCLFGTKFVFVAYDLYPEIAVRTGALRDGNMICRLMNHINKCVFRRVDRVVALSAEMKNFLTENREIAPEKIQVIPNWYADKGTVETGRENNCFRDLVGDRFVVSYFGNMGTTQDMDTILGAIRALGQDDSVFFFFAGHGNKMEKLKTVLQKENLTNTCVRDFLHGQEYLDALAVSDAALISLERDITGLCCPSKTYSYMMQGIPLLAIMDESDIVRDIEQGAGAWVKNGESDILVEKIRQMQRDPEKHASMRQICRKLYLEKYTTPVCTEQYVQLIRDLNR